ncbi:LysR family transcriptional regulator [soil metagenome]
MLAETLNFRRAAERLGIAQPPLSVSIQKLEAELGVRLFDRSASGVKLTRAGQAALVEAQRLLFHGEQFSAAARHASEGTAGSLSVGFVGSTIYDMLPRLIPLFRLRYPDIELALREDTSVNIMRQVVDGSLDVGLVRLPLLIATEATLVTLERHWGIAVLPRGNALGAERQLALSDLASQPFIMYAPTQASGLHSAAMLACQQAGFVPRIAQQATQVQTVISLVESGLGVALVPSTARRDGNDKVLFRELAAPLPEVPLALALAYQPAIESAAARRFRELAAAEYGLESRRS